MGVIMGAEMCADVCLAGSCNNHFAHHAHLCALLCALCHELRRSRRSGRKLKGLWPPELSFNDHLPPLESNIMYSLGSLGTFSHPGQSETSSLHSLQHTASMNKASVVACDDSLLREPTSS